MCIEKNIGHSGLCKLVVDWWLSGDATNRSLGGRALSSRALANSGIVVPLYLTMANHGLVRILIAYNRMVGYGSHHTMGLGHPNVFILLI